MNIFFARHGETQWNRLGKTQGTQDTDLSTLGYRQAEKLADYLHNRYKIDKLYCSKLKRAKKTAEIIGKKMGISPTCDSLLNEISFGLWEGLSIDEIEAKYPGQLAKWRSDLSFSPRGGESLSSIEKNANSFTNSLIEKHRERDKNILVISHSVTIKVLILSITGIPLSFINNIKIGQTGLSLIKVKDTRGIIMYLNNLQHLDERLS